MPLEERNSTIDDFRRDVRSSYSTWVVDNALYMAAGDLCRTHRLRAYDAIQLACAIGVREDAFRVQPPETEPPDIIFISADRGLLSVALAEGFNVENPNNYA